MAEDRAAWCVMTGQAPAVWDELTRMDRAAFMRMARKVHGGG